MSKVTQAVAGVRLYLARDGGAWWAACRLWGRTESDLTEATYKQQQLALWSVKSSPKLCKISLSQAAQGTASLGPLLTSC